MSSVFYGGRLLTSPTVASVVDDSGLGNKNLSVGNSVALVGRSEGGQPNTALRFGSPEQAKAVLRSGELLDAVKKAFDPSAQTGGPSEVVAVRVNPALRSALNLADVAPATVIALAATDYGLYTNQIKVKIEAGTTTGKKLTTQVGNDYFTEDNIARNALTLQYTGAQASSRMSITNTTLTLEAPNSTVVATIDLTVYNTVQKLVDRINAVASFTAAVADGNGARVTLAGLDTVTNADVKTAVTTVKADLQAIVDWFNGLGEGFITATRSANAGTLPVNIPFTYLTGGSDGTITNAEWANAFTALQQVDVQWVSPVSSDPSIHAMADTHVAFMSTVGKMERRSICGMASGTTDVQAIAAAKLINSDRTSLTHLGYYDYDDSGVLILQPPYLTAAGLVGMFAGVNPGTPLTNKTFKARGLERNLRNPTDTDPLIKGGVLCLENTPKGFKVVQSISTWLTNRNYNRVEVSTGVAVDYTIRTVRDALDDLRGQKGSPLLLSRAVSLMETALDELARPEPSGPGVLVGDKASPPYRNVRASLDGDVIRAQFECQPAIGVNYVLVTMYARAYSGTATA